MRVIRMARRVWMPLVTFSLAAALHSGCGSKGPVVARDREWSLTGSQVRAEYDRMKGNGSFERLPLERREQFLETLVNKHLLLEEARRVLPRLSPESERRVRVRTDDRLMQMYNRHLWESWAPDSARFRRAWASFSREARVAAILLRTVEAGDSCRRALESGLPFEQAYRRFDYRRGGLGAVDLGWSAPLTLPPHVARTIFLDELPTGTVAGPVPTARGVWVLTVREYRPFPLDARRDAAERTRAVLRTMLFKDVTLARRDSLRNAHGLALHPESFQSVGTAARGYLDSLRAAGSGKSRLNAWTLRAPVWRLSSDQRLAPVYEDRGRPVPAEEFLRSLDEVDVKYWPLSQQEFPLTREIQDRLDRLFARDDAARSGFTESPEWKETAQRIRDEALLDEYHDYALVQEVDVTPARVESVYAADPGRWKIGARVEFAAVIFPAGTEGEAASFAARLKGANARTWTATAEDVKESVDGSRFLRTSDLLEVGRTPDPPEWAPMLAVAETLQVGQIVGPVPVPQMEGCAVVRLIYRGEEQVLDPPTARVMAERELRLQLVEGRLAGILKAAVERRGVKLYPDRLGSEVTRGRGK